MKRVFLALKVPDEFKNNIIDWEDRRRSLPVKWISPKDFHVTIIPPWNEENVEDFMNKLSEIEGKIGSPRIVFDTVAFGPNRYSPRLIWATGEVPQKIFNLKVLLKDAFGKVSYRNESFMHLTLARFSPEDVERFPNQRMKEDILWTYTFDTLVLMETKITENGPEYEILREYKL